MKANELRIGNWFIQYEEPEEFDGDFYHLSDIKFIPLTEEWIKKFGFKWKNHGLRKSSFCLRQYGSGWNIFMSNESFNFNIELKHVHQLQNLYFALTGKELTFKSE